MNDLVYGIHAAKAALEKKLDSIDVVLLQTNYAHNKKLNQLFSLATQHNLTVKKCTKHELDEQCAGANHQGIILRLKTQADFRLNESELYEYLAGIEEPKFILLLDQIQDPHNLGACLRTAAAAGVHAVIAPKDGAVPITATVRKTACGATTQVPYIQVTNLARCIKQLKELGIWLTGTDLNTEQLPYDVDFKGDIAVAIGSEGKGLRRLTKENCDYLVRIPMPGQFESLNASVATGVLLFEVVRQRTVK